MGRMAVSRWCCWKENSMEAMQSEDCYEQLCFSLYTYAFGTIGFDELLRRFEEILAIRPPQTDQQEDHSRSDTVE